MRVAALLLLVALPAAADTPKPTTTLAVVEVVQMLDECNGAGGEHYVLRIHDGRSGVRLAHAGGHGLHLRLPVPSLAKPGDTKKPPSYVYLAELELAPPPKPVLQGPCLDGLPAFDASARRLVRAKSREHAEQLRTQHARKGLPGPAPTRGVVVIDPPT